MGDGRCLVSWGTTSKCEFDLFKFHTGYVDFWQYLHISVIFNLLVHEGQNNGGLDISAFSDIFLFFLGARLLA